MTLGEEIVVDEFKAEAVWLCPRSFAGPRGMIEGQIKRHQPWGAAQEGPTLGEPRVLPRRDKQEKTADGGPCRKRT